MVRVRTGSRLHFGLLSLATETARWPDRAGEAGLPGRSFGGVGLMVEQPGVEVSVAPTPAWSAEGPLADRALAFARTFAQSVEREGGGTPPPQCVRVEQTAPEHVGLGTGTQLGLAVGQALALAWGKTLTACELAVRVGRGLRSALGVHGFERGGLLVDAGKRGSAGVAPLVARVPFPETWRVVLARPRGEIGLQGAAERRAFGRLLETPAALARTEALCRLVLLGLLPAALEQDLPTFSAALFDFNARVGETFAAVQGGIYASPAIEEMVQFVRSQGILGTGQSSWGPTVFAVVEEERASDLADRLRRRFDLGPAEVLVTRACP
jgi:beta-ribofuranosylaminobenzene 5'-phosphate synthase